MKTKKIFSPKAFKIRASATGKIITNPKKGQNLSKGAIKYCEDWTKCWIYDRSMEFTSKYTDKGLIVEDESIDFVATMLKKAGLVKNEINYSNDYMTGTPDVITDSYIIDLKNSWSWETFPLFVKEVPNQDNYWQAQAYMSLTGIKKFKLIYCLMNTPQHLILKDARNYCYNNGYDGLDIEIYNRYHKKLTYDDVNNRYKMYKVSGDSAV